MEKKAHALFDLQNQQLKDKLKVLQHFQSSKDDLIKYYYAFDEEKGDLCVRQININVFSQNRFFMKIYKDEVVKRLNILPYFIQGVADYLCNDYESYFVTAPLLPTLLDQRLPKLEREVKGIFLQLIEAFFELHIHGIEHFTICLEHVGYENKKVCLQSFGFESIYILRSKQFDDEDFFLSPQYQGQKLEKQRFSSKEQDMYNLGALIVRLINGNPNDLNYQEKRTIELRRLTNAMMSEQESQRMKWEELIDNIYFEQSMQPLDRNQLNSKYTKQQIKDFYLKGIRPELNQSQCSSLFQSQIKIEMLDIKQKPYSNSSFESNTQLDDENILKSETYYKINAQNLEEENAAEKLALSILNVKEQLNKNNSYNNNYSYDNNNNVNHNNNNINNQNNYVKLNNYVNQNNNLNNNNVQINNNISNQNNYVKQNSNPNNNIQNNNNINNQNNYVKQNSNPNNNVQNNNNINNQNNYVKQNSNPNNNVQNNNANIYNNINQNNQPIKNQSQLSNQENDKQKINPQIGILKNQNIKINSSLDNNNTPTSQGNSYVSDKPITEQNSENEESALINQQFLENLNNKVNPYKIDSNDYEFIQAMSKSRLQREENQKRITEITTYFLHERNKYTIITQTCFQMFMQPESFSNNDCFEQPTYYIQLLISMKLNYQLLQQLHALPFTEPYSQELLNIYKTTVEYENTMKVLWDDAEIMESWFLAALFDLAEFEKIHIVARNMMSKAYLKISEELYKQIAEVSIPRLKRIFEILQPVNRQYQNSIWQLFFYKYQLIIYYSQNNRKLSTENFQKVLNLRINFEFNINFDIAQQIIQLQCQFVSKYIEKKDEKKEQIALSIYQLKYFLLYILKNFEAFPPKRFNQDILQNENMIDYYQIIESAKKYKLAELKQKISELERKN